MSIIYKNGTYYGGGGVGAEITIDNELSSTSENPVQNKVIKAELDKKVDKVTGKGLSTNDYTDEEKNKLSGITAGAEPNVQSDWDQTDTSADDFIKNKPEFATVATSGSYNDLSNKPSIPDATAVKGDAETDYRTGNVNITKANIGLGNVENKSSATIRSELTSSDIIAGLDFSPVDSALIGANNGIAELDANGKVPSSQLPSSSIEYSVNEQTIGKWINGSVLYQRTYIPYNNCKIYDENNNEITSPTNIIPPHGYIQIDALLDNSINVRYLYGRSENSRYIRSMPNSVFDFYYYYNAFRIVNLTENNIEFNQASSFFITMQYTKGD